MNARLKNIADQVRALPHEEREEFLSWLAEDEISRSDSWDDEIAMDSLPGGRLEPLLNRVRKDIAEGRTKPLDEVLNDT
jgi:hypothetical protein